MASISIFGVERPIAFDDIKNGQLVTGINRDDRWFGLAATDDQGPIYLVFRNDGVTIWSRDAVDAPFAIDGDLVVEPAEVGKAFRALGTSGTKTGLFLAPDGQIGVRAVSTNGGSSFTRDFNLETGVEMPGIRPRFLSGVSLKVSQKGCDDLFEIVSFL